MTMENSQPRSGGMLDPSAPRDFSHSRTGMRRTQRRVNEEPARRIGDHDSAGERLARGLGWFSLGLGLAELAAPGRVAKLIGVADDDNSRALLQAVGVREIATGIGILTREKSAPLLMGRVAGDVMDLVLLGSALRSNGRPGRIAAATAAVIGVTAVDMFGARKLLEEADHGRVRSRARGRLNSPSLRGGFEVNKAITVSSSPDEVYRFWRNLENLPRFMSHLKSVESGADGCSHWIAKAPAGTSVEWDAEIVADDPGRLISWRSRPGADVENEGTVCFAAAPGGRGTEIIVKLQYRPPAGALGKMVAKMFGEAPDQQIGSDLRRLKQVIETGEVVHSDASIHVTPHAARPSGSTAHASR